jgi:hypothetical protein
MVSDFIINDFDKTYAKEFEDTNIICIYYSWFFVILKDSLVYPILVALFFSYVEIHVNALKYSSIATMHSMQAV